MKILIRYIFFSFLCCLINAGHTMEDDKNIKEPENPFVGKWHYRSLHNNPNETQNWTDLKFGEADIDIIQVGFNQITGTLGGEGWSLQINGQTTFGYPNQIRFRGTGMISDELWVYDYEGYLAPMWTNGVDQTPSIVGTIVRTKEHSKGKSEAGYTASWYAVKKLNLNNNPEFKIPPAKVIEIMSSHAHRLHHFVWHQLRNNWHRYSELTKIEIDKLGWTPGGDFEKPRTAFYLRKPYYEGEEEPKTLAIDNNSGEDFLYMHRKMIEQVNEILKEVDDPKYKKVEGWKFLPEPGDKNFPVPESWENNDEGLKKVKSNEFFKDTMQVWEKYYTNPENLKRLSLGQLGSLIEFTIHNQMHNRWRDKPSVERPKPTGEVGIPEGPWDNKEYDYLGDEYSSHVNPIFWYLHGWVDSCIERWKEANQIKEIDWKGKWIGPMPKNAKPNNFITVLSNMKSHDHHMENLTKVVKLIGECKIFSSPYIENK